MSSPNIGPGDLSTSPLTNSSARKRQTTGAPVYSPNETLNQMTREAEARQHDKYTAQKEIRAIRAKEMEKQRKEDEEKEREETNRINRAISSNNYTSTTNGSSVPKVYLIKNLLRVLINNSYASLTFVIFFLLTKINFKLTTFNLNKSH